MFLFLKIHYYLIIFPLHDLTQSFAIIHIFNMFSYILKCHSLYVSLTFLYVYYVILFVTFRKLLLVCIYMLVTPWVNIQKHAPLRAKFSDFAHDTRCNGRKKLCSSWQIVNPFTLSPFLCLLKGFLSPPAAGNVDNPSNILCISMSCCWVRWFGQKGQSASQV